MDKFKELKKSLLGDLEHMLLSTVDSHFRVLSVGSGWEDMSVAVGVRG